jgi:hypothetical protein
MDFVSTSTGRADHVSQGGARAAARGTRDRTSIPPPGVPGHGLNASLRRQPTRIVQGRMEGGYTSAFELICGDCGDRPYWDYSELSFQLQRTRGPYTLDAGLEHYHRHLGLAG